MSDNRMVYHDGVVVGAQGNRLQIKIVSQSACSECHAKGACPASEMVEKIIDAQSSPGESLFPGDIVTITMAAKLGRKAVFFAFVLPLFVMSITLFSTFALGLNQSLAGLCSLASLLPYYLLLYTFRQKIEKDFIFYAHKKK